MTSIIRMFALSRNHYSQGRGFMVVLKNILIEQLAALVLPAVTIPAVACKKRGSEKTSSILNRILRKIENNAFNKAHLPGTI